MIENLNRQGFAPFGKILRDSLPNRGFPQNDDWIEAVSYRSSDDQAYYRRYDKDIYLDFDLGMTVLAVRRDGRSDCFYLDKPVCLSAGTDFAVIPYQNECSFRISVPKDAEETHCEALNALENLKIGDRLHLGEIYTLFYREEESGFLFKGERHPMYELTYVDRGQLYCVVDGNSFSLRQGQLMIFGPDQWHMQHTDMDNSVRFLTVAFDLTAEMELRLADRVFEMSSEEAIYLKQIIRETDTNDQLSGDFIRSNLKLLLLSILRDAGGRKKRLKTPLAIHNENLIVSRTLQYIADHVYDKLSVEIVSHEAGVSASHLTALFRRQMKISPGEYIRRVKLEESKNLIREGKMNFSQIAAALQYSTIHHFSRQFKDNFGMSPSEYAKSLQITDVG